VSANTGGGVQPVALNGLSPDYGDIGRSVNEYAFWTVEYLYTYGPATGLAEAFLKYLGTPTAKSDLQATDYTPSPPTAAAAQGASARRQEPDSGRPYEIKIKQLAP